MNNTLMAISFGGIAGVTLAVADAFMFGTAIEIETILKYGVPIAGFVWWVGRQFQKVQDELAAAAKEREVSRRSFEAIGLAIHTIHEAIEEIRGHCKECGVIMRTKTKFAVDLDTPKV